MALTAGSQLGPYEIQSALGAGGLGDLYKARDTWLDRTVAIKVLPASWADDPDLKQHFERDAKTIAGLNHPHICTVHDFGRERPQPTRAAGPSEASGTPGGEAVPSSADGPAASPVAEEPEIDFLVLEHLEGETVADRLTRAVGAAASKKKQAFRVDEALAIAMQIVDALDKAHQKGLVHRGLKPSSVILVRSGKSSDPPIAKLLDLGMTGTAGPKQQDPAHAAQSLPTREHATAQSTIVGAVEYLAPEQVEGKEADARTDLFALGVVLYEMLTGRKAFEGKSRAVLMAAIMTAEPDPLLAAQPLAPPALDHVLNRCLAKDPEDRWQTAHDLLIQLRWITGSGAVTTGLASLKDRRQQWAIRAALAAAVAMIAALSVPLARYLRGSADQEPFQFRSPVVGLNNADISVSPDGRNLAFMARPNQQQPSSLFVRPVGSLASRRLAGTDDATQPFWSPDSRLIRGGREAQESRGRRRTAAGDRRRQTVPRVSARRPGWCRCRHGTTVGPGSGVWPGRCAQLDRHVEELVFRDSCKPQAACASSSAIIAATEFPRRRCSSQCTIDMKASRGIPWLLTLGLQLPRSRLTAAAAPLIIPNARRKQRGDRKPLIGKFSTAAFGHRQDFWLVMPQFIDYALPLSDCCRGGVIGPSAEREDGPHLPWSDPGH